MIRFFQYTASSFNRFLALSVLCVLAFMLSGCGMISQQPPAPEIPTALTVWDKFIQHTATPQMQDGIPVRAFKLTASLNYAGPKAKNRVILSFWGNLDFPVRLDLQTGLGQTLSYWREDTNGFTAYVPSKEAAFMHKDGRLGMAAFGLKLPFTLRDMALLLNGGWSTLLPETYVTTRHVEKKKAYSYAFSEAGQTYTILLDYSGHPLEMATPATKGSKPWHLEFVGNLEDLGLPLLPKKIRMTRGTNEKAIVFIKKLEQHPTPMPEASLLLDLPPGTSVQILENTQ